MLCHVIYYYTGWNVKYVQAVLIQYLQTLRRRLFVLALDKYIDYMTSTRDPESRCTSWGTSWSTFSRWFGHKYQGGQVWSERLPNFEPSSKLERIPHDCSH